MPAKQNIVEGAAPFYWNKSLFAYLLKGASENPLWYRVAKHNKPDMYLCTTFDKHLSTWASEGKRNYSPLHIEVTGSSGDLASKESVCEIPVENEAQRNCIVTQDATYVSSE